MEPLHTSGIPGCCRQAPFWKAALFSEISEYKAICEIADSRAGYNPELSYGSHFFQDLVESEILYTAIFEKMTGAFL